MRRPDFVNTILIGGFGGALFVSVVTHLLYTARYPRAIYDGQYGMIFMATAPLGWLVGSAIGAVVAWRAGTRPPRAGLTTGLIIVGGVVAGPFLGLAGLWALDLAWLLLHPRSLLRP